jgi:hypothetical protein
VIARSWIIGTAVVEVLNAIYDTARPKRPAPRGMPMVGQLCQAAAFVSVMEAANPWDRHDPALAGPGDPARNRRIFGEQQVSSRPLVVRTIDVHQPLQSGFIEHDDVI